MANRVLKPTPRQEAFINCPADMIFFGGARSGGKSLSFNELCISPKGFVRNGDLQVGDELIGADGGVQHVEQIFDQGVKRIYRFEFSDGGICRCTADHLWKVRKVSNRGRDCGWMLMTTRDIRDAMRGGWGNRFFIPASPAIKGVFAGETLEQRKKRFWMTARQGIARSHSPSWFASKLADLGRSCGYYVKVGKPDRHGAIDIEISEGKEREIKGIYLDCFEPARCIRVSNPDHLYMAGDFAVTHNTYGDGLLVLDRVQKYGTDFRSLFIRRFNPELEDAIDQFKGIFGDYAQWKGSENIFTFWNGAKLKMGYIEKEDDVKKFQGKQYALEIFDEVTNFQNFNIVERMRGCLRNSHGFPNQLILTGNPGGPLHTRLKMMFVDPAPQGDVLIPDGYSEELGRPLYKCFIPSLVKDNPYISKDYVEQLKRSGTPAQVKQWLDGCWDETEDAAFADLFRYDVHVVGNFKVPSSWRLFKSYDYGSSKPWACTWFAVSDGSDFIAADGKPRPTIDGDVFAVAELYGCLDGRPNEGTKESIQQQAAKIRLVEEQFFKGFTIAQSIADSAIFAKNGAYCIAEDFEQNGVFWEPCAKAPGFRHQGYVLLRERLLGSIERDGKPGIFWMKRCRNSIRTIPALQMDRSAVDCVATNSSSEDHLYDETAYFLQSQKPNWVMSGSTNNY